MFRDLEGETFMIVVVDMKDAEGIILTTLYEPDFDKVLAVAPAVV